MNNFRICNKCKISKTEEDTNFRLCTYKNGSKYFKSTCRDCERQNSKQYSQKHKEKIKQYQIDFAKKNPQYIKNWKISNKNKINERERNRRKNDINFKLKKNISRAISHAIFKCGNSTIKFLPYTIDDLKQYLENQFDNEMSWDNYGVYWHIDHIIPHSTFKYDSMEDIEFKRCWSLNNLRPLEAKQNRLDGANRIRHKIVEFASEYADNTI